MPRRLPSSRVAAVRRFNRFYTQRIGALQEGWAESPFPLAQARVLYEVIRRDQPTATELAKNLGLDPGYLSRILRGFERRGLIVRRPSRTDGRQSLLSATARGRKAFAPIEARTNSEVETMLRPLSGRAQRRLCEAMDAIESVLDERSATTEPPYILRPPRAGDFGWIVSRHGALYGEEYGWDERIEGLTAEIVAAFIRTFDSRRERCWIAERDGENVGCVFLVRETDEIARLRLLLVTPQARGLGLGARLVDECIAFARATGYRKVTLWTHSILTAARHIYQKAGFRLTGTEKHNRWGRDVTSEFWDLPL